MKTNSRDTISSERFHFTRCVRFWPLALSILIAFQAPVSGGLTSGNLDEVVGKPVRNYQGEKLGEVSDIALDVEHGRFVGVLIRSGGFLGLWQQELFVPTSALSKDEATKVLYLNMSRDKFKQAPTFAMSRTQGPPDIDKMVEVFNYYGQKIYFNPTIGEPTSSSQKEQLGFIQKGTELHFMAVENLQGRPLGHVVGLRGLNLSSGMLKGIVILPIEQQRTGTLKIIEPQALRYNLDRNRLRLSNRHQEFSDSPIFDLGPDGSFEEQAPQRPGMPVLALVQGNSPEDKRITEAIISRILRDRSLSHYAQNIQVTTLNGKTTVRGRVEREAGRKKIVAHATKVAGKGNVTDAINSRAQSATEVAIDS